MVMPGRSHAVGGAAYRYGMNGQEKENEVFDAAFSAEFWMYDSRLGRRWEVDLITHDWESPYASFSNNPIALSDVKGDADGTKGKKPKGNFNKRSKKKGNYGGPGGKKNRNNKNTKGKKTGGKDSDKNGNNNDQKGKKDPKKKDPKENKEGKKDDPGQNTQSDNTNKKLPIWFVYEQFSPFIYENTKQGLGRHPEWNVLTYAGGSESGERRYEAMKSSQYKSCGAGWSRDEFPYATTSEGGKGANTECVPESENWTQGQLLNKFYRDNNMKVGDKFIIQLVPKQGPPKEVPAPIPVPELNPMFKKWNQNPNFKKPKPVPIPVAPFSPFLRFLDRLIRVPIFIIDGITPWDDGVKARQNQTSRVEKNKTDKNISVNEKSVYKDS